MALRILGSLFAGALNQRLYCVFRSYSLLVCRTHRTDQTRLIGKREAGRLFGVSKQTIDGWIKAGKLPQPRRSFFSVRWDYETLAPLVKFKPNKTRSAPEDSDHSELTAETRHALNTDFDFKNRTEAEERETNSQRPDLQRNRA
jgi:predicted DNA-binding transcriptional regulator AlpA